MAATLDIINYFKLDSLNNTDEAGAGPTTQTDPTSPWTVDTLTILGDLHKVKKTSLANATALTIWDEDDDTPSDWQYFWISVDQDTVYLQFVGQTSNVKLLLSKNVPFVWTNDQLLCAVAVTAMAAAPTLEDIDSCVLYNNSGNTVNIKAFFIN